MPPRWATNLIKRVAEDYNVAIPGLTWGQRRGQLSSGLCTLDTREIEVRAGTDKNDQRLTLLHELAHVVLLSKWIDYAGEHTERFYQTVWALYRRYRVPIQHALRVERSRRSLVAYRKAGGRLK